ncbi:trypsin-like serine peptidase [Actinoplanes derwentensis]|uniref:Trypsin-like peptidase domain-containing protein n=1 Tax=Actinoplanes derwentensis TaxID=113562 RepID=A0A1H2AWU2_9ACTN|nr:trypsin-like peptidase domain-containing protein [Actinoplanes derwentensis]GID87270.1 hypothetical protein Ade03nite_61940 [Actinoplanes derwentensis]SDT50448.1 Trypsin-like peptidase domain-containing protein [Actinoplanes derwentensis]
MPEAREYLKAIAVGGERSNSLETAASGGGSTDPAIRTGLTERLDAEIGYIARVTGMTADPGRRLEILRLADSALAKLLGEGEAARLTPADISGLEAVVATDGSRPVLFVKEDLPVLDHPAIGGYREMLSRMQEDVRVVCRSVGRVDDPDPAVEVGYHGTAWAIDEGVVVTNYHVLQAIAPQATRIGGRFEGRLKPGVAVNFGHEAGGQRPDRRFPIRRVLRVGSPAASAPTGPGLDFHALDLAVLELEPVAGRPFPDPVTVARGDDPMTMGGLATKGRTVYVTGYPGDPTSTTPNLMATLFNGVLSCKRLSPGVITDAPGELSDDPRGWVMTHDASTLGGSSGSLVADLTVFGRTGLGLHFAGQHARRNWAHALERITRELHGAIPVGSR